MVTHALCEEMEGLRASACSPLLEGPLSPSDLDLSSLPKIQDALQSYSPHLDSRSTVSSPTSEATSRVGATIASSLMLKFRDAKASGMQLLATLIPIAKGTKKEAMTTLNHLGVALSYHKRGEDFKACQQKVKFK